MPVPFPYPPDPQDESATLGASAGHGFRIEPTRMGPQGAAPDPVGPASPVPQTGSPLDLMVLDRGDAEPTGLAESAPDAPEAPPSTPLDIFTSSFGETTEWLRSTERMAQARGNLPRGSEAGPQWGALLLQKAMGEDTADPNVPRDELRKRFPQVKGIDQDMPEAVAEEMASQQQRKAVQDDIAARYPAGLGSAIAGLGAGIVSGLLDPMNDVAFMVPVVGESRYAAWLARASEEAGLGGRLAVTAGVGAARGVAGQGVLDIARYATGDPDMTLGRVAEDSLQAGLMGGILHPAFGFREDVLGERFVRSAEGQAAINDAILHDRAVRAASGQMADWGQIEVRPVFDSRGDLLNSTAVGRAQPYLDEAVAAASGRPDQETVRVADMAEEAKRTPPPKVLEARTAESEAMISELRQAGLLTPEDEAELAAHEEAIGAIAPEEGEARSETPGARSDTQLPTPAEEAAARPVVPIPGVEGIPAGVVAQALKDVGELETRAPGSNTLFREIRKLGGIRTHDTQGNPYTVGPDIGDALAGLGRARRGLASKAGGLPAEQMAAALADRGWFGVNPEDPSGAFEQAVNAEASGQPVFHPEDQTPAVLERRAQIQRDLETLGANPAEGHAATVARLAAYRHATSETGEAMAQLRARADALGVPHDETTTHDDLIGDVIEREALQAEAVASTGDQLEHEIDDRLTARDWQRLLERSRSGLAEEHGEGPGAPGLAGGPDDERGRQEEARAAFEGAVGGGEPAPAGEAARGHDLVGASPRITAPNKPAHLVAAQAGKVDDATFLAARKIRDEALARYDAADEAVRNAPNERPAERVNLAGEIVEQQLIPGGEASAVQAAAARGETLRASVPQHEPGGLFAPPEPEQGALFQRPAGADALRGELAKDRPIAEGQLPPEDAAARAVIDNVHALLGKIVPGADARAYGALRDMQGEPVFGVVFREGLQHVIAWSLESPDAIGTARHEAVHVLRKMGLISDAEWSALENAAAERNWTEQFDIARRYPDLNPAQQTEEAVAEAFGHGRQDPAFLASLPEFAQNIYRRVRDVLTQVGSFLHETFGQGVTADEVMRRIESGEVGARSATETGPTQPAFQRTGSLLEAREQEKMIAERQRLTAMQDIAKRVTLQQKVNSVRGAGLSLAHGFDALTRGISEAVPGARDSTAQHQLSRQNEYISRLLANLEKVPGAMEAWRRSTVTADWVRELAELNKHEGGEPGVTKNPMALDIAKAVQDAQNLARLGLNRAGAWVGDYDGYVARTLHDAVKIHDAGFDQWQRDVLAGIDKEKTFGDVMGGEVNTSLYEMWNRLSTGLHLTSENGVGMKQAAFGPGPGNIARRASAERVLHWKDADAWRQYQEKYGDPSIERGVLHSLDRAGRDTALIQDWGSKPKEQLENLINQVRIQHLADHDAIAKLEAELPRIREEFAYLTGEAQRPGTSLAWKVRGSIIAAQDISKLGNVLLAHMSIGATKPFQLAYQGIGRWQAYTSVLRNLAEDKSPQGRQILENLRANATGQMQNLMSGYEPVDGVPGQIARIRQLSMRLGGLPWMLARQKSGAEWELANFMGQNVGKPYGALDPRTQRGLAIYGIRPEEWDALRTAPDHDRDGTGSTYLTPMAAYRANVDSLAGSRLERALDEEDAERIRGDVRDRLAMKLASYYADSAERAAISPGIPERAFFSLHAGRFAGPIVGQYKIWAMAAVRQMWGQALYGSSKAEAAKSLLELAAVGTAIGYARLALTSALRGEAPQGPTGDWRQDGMLAMKSALAGGGFGIFGDYLMGQYTRYGSGERNRAGEFVSNLVGPSVGDVASLYAIGSDIAGASFAEDPGHALSKSGGEAMRFVTDHTPFINTWYLRGLSHWLFVDRLNEMANPGYLQRHEDAVKAHGNAGFWLPPTHYLGAPA